MPIGFILLLIAIVLACSCAGLLVVRMSNPRLLGLGWLGAAFATGGMGSILLLGSDQLPKFFSYVVADVLVLAAFVLLHAGVLELVELPPVPVFGLFLLGVQASSDVLRVYGGVTGNFRITVAGLLIALQAGQTAMVLFKTMKRGARAPGYFSATLMLVFMAFNLVRSTAMAMGKLTDPAQYVRFETLTFTVYLAFVLSIAFGFFWMTTATLTDKLDELASTDPLTRLYNRRVFMRWCEREQARTRETGVPFTILMVDLDHFKRVNDQYGHASGDMVLCNVVEKMQGAVRGIDVLGRWGGEEFVALLPGASAEAAFLVANRVRGNIERTQIPVSTHGDHATPETVRVTASVGVATYEGPNDSIEEMLARADDALYRAKAGGRNRVLGDVRELAELYPIPTA